MPGRVVDRANFILGVDDRLLLLVRGPRLVANFILGVDDRLLLLVRGPRLVAKTPVRRQVAIRASL